MARPGRKSKTGVYEGKDQIHIQVKVDEKVYNEYKKACRKIGQNPSSAMKILMADWIKKQKNLLNLE